MKFHLSSCKNYVIKMEETLRLSLEMVKREAGSVSKD